MPEAARGDREPPRSISLHDRAVAPDLARGMMLLLIALANAHLYLFGHPSGTRGYPAELTGASRPVALAQMLLVDGRAYPLFGMLFGYGIVQLARRSGDPVTARRLVRRRGRWMVLIGALHGLLLFSGDIVAAYGLLAVLMAGRLISGSDRALRRTLVAGLVVASVVGLGIGLPPPPGSDQLLPSMSEPDPVAATLLRSGEFALLMLAGMLLVFGAVALGALAARRRLLDEPAAHRTLLTRAAAGGLAVAVLGGLPMALITAGYWSGPSMLTIALASSLHTVTGYAGGIGYAALFGLVAGWRGPVVRALVACGQRSLTCYLAQSVVFVGLLAAVGGGLGGELTIAWTALVAFGAWLVILLGADLMGRRGARGPAEALLRRLTYRGT